MTEPTCVRCGRPIADGYACTAETAKAAAQLAQLADMTPAARDVAHGLSKRGGGGAGGKPGSRLPLDLGATAKLDGVQNVLTTWARHVAETRGVELPEVPVVLPASGPVCSTRYGCLHESCKPIRDPERPPLLGVVVARWLGDQLEWLRHRPEVDGVLADIQAAARVVAGIARGPAPQKYLGPCEAVRMLIDAYDDEFEYESEPCDGDVYVRGDASVGRCRLCGAEVARGDREAWLDAEVRQYAYTPTEIADAYPIKRNTINQWASRGRLTAHDTDPNGRTRYKLGDVLDLAAVDAARRETDRATRERRAAIRA